MKKIVALIVVGGIIVSGFTFADVKVASNKNVQGFMLPTAESLELPLQKEQVKLTFREHMSQALTAYAPDYLDDFESAWANHDAVHVLLTQAHEAIKAAKKMETEAFLTNIKAQVKAGTMTREQAKVEIETFKASRVAERDARTAAIEALKVQYNVSQEANKAMHQALVDAAKAQDAEAFSALVPEALSMLLNHIAFDEAKLALISQ